MTIEERLNTLEQTNKLLQEELMYCHKDLAALFEIIENLQEPEYHFHYYSDFRTCKECKENDSVDLNDFI